ncbi:Acyl-CoA dehydrogenase, short-chain specific [Acaryochloris thomasi RCC1774]|uniref:Acyl-CoA dehydrogenase, short-chain specific n=1 Tax=Acaryochloris thomasi RCC1774 TaxID=1764569 RepID=A0A2W1JC97_9CYAN|nr:acyl-CoA dehydrogenase family protein [Acaryochloris thomasi]PZD71630.1 Acyl-CoA dehydrogenase, short-chain specific [Acaryochloris thomasi RCC1774]
MSERLKQTQAYLQAKIAPQAAELDRDPQRLAQAVKDLGNEHLLGLRVDPKWGGQGLNSLAFLQFQELVSRYSGALAFLQTQHQSAASMLAASQNEALKQQYLSEMVSGKLLMGVGFSQLRRQGVPVLKAVPSETGYQLYGEVPWITGFGCFQQFIVGATLPNGESLFGLMPFEAQTQVQGGRLCLSEPLQLAVMESTQTVEATVRDWYLPQTHVLSIQPARWIHEKDRRNVLQHSFFALGCAQAGLDIVAAAQANLPDFVERGLRSQLHTLDICRQAIYQAHLEPESSFEHRLALRAEAIDMAVRCAHMAVIVSRGAANYRDHPAQRVYREALAFTVFGQTTAVMEATLQKIV